MIIKDNYGVVELDEACPWGVNTQRSLANFNIGDEKMPKDLIQALIMVKKAVAITNGKQGVITQDIADAIVKSCDDLIDNYDSSLYPLSLWQTGSGTQTNMNVNEVIARHALRMYGIEVHPNDDVNASQSSNDVFPTAMHVMTKMMLNGHLLPNIEHLVEVLEHLEIENHHVYKVGRTHLQDAVPMSFGQEISAWKEMVLFSLDAIKQSMSQLSEIPIGGTAVGTGLNTPKDFDTKVSYRLSKLTGVQFVAATNKFMGLSSKNAILNTHSALTTFATDLFKIANDIRWLVSGPRSGLSEITIPSNEAGSSIMPGKVNPTQAEALMMVCTQVFGNNATMTFGNANGNFQLNVMMPLMAYNMYQSIILLGDAIESFSSKCLEGMLPNRNKMQLNLNQSLMVSTRLNPELGYDLVSTIVKQAQQEGKTIRDIIVQRRLIDESKLDELLDFESMIYVHKSKNE